MLCSVININAIDFNTEQCEPRLALAPDHHRKCIPLPIEPVIHHYRVNDTCLNNLNVHNIAAMANGQLGQLDDPRTAAALRTDKRRTAGAITERTVRHYTSGQAAQKVIYKSIRTPPDMDSDQRIWQNRPFSIA